MKHSAKVNDSILYPNATLYFFLALVVTWIGFSHSYFRNLAENDIFHHLHGAIAGGWIIVLMIQPLLYKQGKLALHRKIGKLAVYILFPLLILGGLKMIHSMLNNPSAYPPGATIMLAFLDFYSILMLLYFVYQAINKASQLQLHARYLSLTVLAMLPPAIGRMLFYIPWINSFEKSLNVSYSIIIIITGVLLLDDKKRGAIYPPYKIAMVLFLIQLISLNFVGQWQWWASLMTKFASL
ncbi:MAG: hypothetical protein NTZ19_14285 [Bacteroidetes bacterium]|nr:hypothetical protein [Bacteroidota bacterium]